MKTNKHFILQVTLGWLLAYAILFIFLEKCSADQTGQIVLDSGAAGFPPDTSFRYQTWQNNTGQTMYIHSLELKMYTEMNDMEGRMSSGVEVWRSSTNPARNGSYFVWGSLYCVSTDPTLLDRTYDPNPVTLLPGEAIVMRYYASYPNLASNRFFDGVIIWYSLGAP